ncbi:pentapeptide repeat-containing protein [Bradyrhizobium japonicum]|uniref:pentapeptide repeat-containing protein n=1 Tax=Bradyrhizobium japonicum TaxID=375 RepID=UPI0004BC06BB|nr:pentapeptide repeat-containing protein [Bradyrhizobium japonicum]
MDLSAPKQDSLPLTGRKLRSLRILSPDAIGKAADESATQVTRIGLTFLGTTAFCLLSLLSPDSALLGVGSEKTAVVNVPFAGPVSFFGFMLLGPTVLIVLRIYLQIYVEHSERLERLARSMSVARTPMLVPLQNPLIRGFSGLTFYLLLPLTMFAFAWKAAAFPASGSALLVVAAVVIASHLVLPLKKFSGRSKALLSSGAAIVVFAMLVGNGPVRRPFYLFRANLTGQYFSFEDFMGAQLNNANLSDTELFQANLSRAYLIGADLSRAKLGNANLSRAHVMQAKLNGTDLVLANLSGAFFGSANLNGADLRSAKLTGADLRGTDLTGADLGNAKLSRAHLGGANLSAAKHLTQEQLDETCGDADTKLPEGLTLKKTCTLEWFDD